MPERAEKTFSPLERWLHIVTFDLCDEAKARVRAEIESHVQEIVAARMKPGVTRRDAETAAVKELGNPFDAQDKLNRAYLSGKQAVNLQRILNEVRCPMRPRNWIICCVIIMIASISSRHWGASWREILAFAQFTIAFFGLFWALFSLLHRVRTFLTVKRFMLIRVVLIVLAVVIFAQANKRLLPQFNASDFGLILFWGYAFNEWFLYRKASRKKIPG